MFSQDVMVRNFNGKQERFHLYRWQGKTDVRWVEPTKWGTLFFCPIGDITELTTGEYQVQRNGDMGTYASEQDALMVLVNAVLMPGENWTIAA